MRAERELLDAMRILRQRRQSTWEGEALEVLVTLYGEAKLDYPRKQAEIRDRLQQLGE